MISVSDFYTGAACPEALKIRKMNLDKAKRNLLLKQSISVMSELMLKGFKKEEILKEIGEILHYEPAWFLMPWQAKTQAEDDLYVFDRFIDWFTAAGYTLIKCNAKTHYNYGSIELKQQVSLIAEKEGKTEGFIIDWRQSKFSPRGRSIHTKLSNFLKLRVAKQYLEPLYPGIELSSVSMMNSKDRTGNLLSQFDGSGKTNNYYTANWESYVDEALGFNLKDFETDTKRIIAEPVQKKCADCFVKQYCEVPNVNMSEIAIDEQEHCADSVPVVVKKDTYKVPNFSKSQLEAVQTIEGPISVLAGPGSGKTAVITGRILEMKKRGIPMNNVLCITFAKKAAGELRERILPYMDENFMPTISTLNSLGYDILRQNAGIVGKKVLASDTDFKVLLKSVMALNKPIPGISYASYNAYEKNGLYDTVYTRFSQYKSLGSEAFFEQYPQIGRNEFEAVYQMYIELISQRNLITFDEQISMAVTFLKEHTAIRKQYHNMYRYIMVDEYQDISSEDAEFIEMLVNPETNNICVVGDDDQAIYGFRGGSNQYLIDFGNKYKAKTVVLGENYRSDINIVRSAQSVISANVNRMSKDVVSVNDKGVYPEVYDYADVSVIEALIKRYLDEGYKYSDIAILNIKNAPLDKLNKELGIPTVLVRAMLRDDRAFRLAHQLLDLSINGLDDASLFKTIRMFSKKISMEIAVLNQSDTSLYDKILKKYSLHPVTDVEYYMRHISKYNGIDGMESIYARIAVGLEMVKQLEPEELIPQISRIFFNDDVSVSGNMVADIIKSYNIKSMSSLYSMLNNMILFKDDKRIDYEKVYDAVKLLTAHDSKGKEFPCVIIWNAGEFEDDEESVRLLYVAMTRAKERLAILKPDASKGHLLERLKYVKKVSIEN